jgi:hypothetical protein
MKRVCLLVLPLLMIAAVLGACTATNYRSLDAAPEAETLFSRDVYYRLADSFYRDMPRCVVVLPPAEAGAATLLGDMVELSLARHLGQRIDRVIGPGERRKAERELALNTRNHKDRRYLAERERCPAYLAWRVTTAEDSHFLVWSQKQFGLEVTLARADDDTILWQAAHSTSRSDGGLPLSLLTLPVAAAEAIMFSQDADQLPSMIDDVVRRLMVTLPDVR